jgi:hypothetical protein
MDRESHAVHDYGLAGMKNVGQIDSQMEMIGSQPMLVLVIPEMNSIQVVLFCTHHWAFVPVSADVHRILFR